MGELSFSRQLRKKYAELRNNPPHYRKYYNELEKKGTKIRPLAEIIPKTLEPKTGIPNVYTLIDAHCPNSCSDHTFLPQVILYATESGHEMYFVNNVWIYIRGELLPRREKDVSKSAILSTDFQGLVVSIDRPNHCLLCAVSGEAIQVPLEKDHFLWNVWRKEPEDLDQPRNFVIQGTGKVVQSTKDLEQVCANTVTAIISHVKIKNHTVLVQTNPCIILAERIQDSLKKECISYAAIAPQGQYLGEAPNIN